jgi:branched-chain amino acid transport system ATP-binding protein
VTTGLRIENLCVDRGGRTVIRNLSLQVPAGRPTIVFGPNGAGKSTLFLAVSGLIPIRAGAIAVDGVSVNRMDASARARVGVAQQFQSLRLFEHASVVDNVACAMAESHSRQLWTALISRTRALGALRRSREEAFARLAEMGLESVANMRPSELSYGQQKLVAILRAMVGRPRVLLLDEPLAGLSNSMKRTVDTMIGQHAASGATVVVIEHDIWSCRDFGWWGAFMNEGSVQTSGNLGRMLSDPEVVRPYFGGSGLDSEATHDASGMIGADHRALDVAGLTAGYGRQDVIHDVKFRVEPGESLGIVGLNGSGKSTIVKALFGLVDARRGTILLGDEDLTQTVPHAKAQHRIIFLSQDGAVLDSLTVEENMRLAHWLQGARHGARPPELPETIASLRNRKVGSLSGGERRLVASLRLDVVRPNLVLLDEPSIGLSPTSLKQVASRIRGQWIAHGCPPMVLAEQNLTFLRHLATKIMILRQGRIVSIGTAIQMTDRTIADALGFSGSLGVQS